MNSAVLVHDEFAQTAADVFWEFCRQSHRDVVSLLKATGDGDVSAILARFAAGEPAGTDMDDLNRLLTSRFTEGRAPWRETADKALAADAISRLFVHVGGDQVTTTPAVTADEIASVAVPLPLGAHDARVLIVIPFRDDDPARPRLRNLLACLVALADQSVPRSSYRCVVVELDSEPRHEQQIRPMVDGYLHATCIGRFNKAWAVNIGVVAESRQADLLCILDNDVLVDRDFVRRNVLRFNGLGAQAHWPYVDALCLSPVSTDHAIRRRCFAGADTLDPREFRGVYLRRPPGHCIWLRLPLFMSVQGMDERFEGWGGEDLDFVYRVGFVASIDRYHDPLLHMFHPRPAVRENGQWFFAERRFLSWRPIEAFGRPERPARCNEGDSTSRSAAADVAAPQHAILTVGDRSGGRC